MKFGDILHILSKDQATKALQDISLIDKTISTIPTEEYIQTFISQFTSNTYIINNSGARYIAITEKPMLYSRETSPSDLDLEVESGIWVYRTNGKNNKSAKDNESENEFGVCHEFLYFGNTPKPRKYALNHIKEYKKCSLYNWMALIDTSTEEVTMWVHHKRTGKWRQQGRQLQ